MLLFALNNWKWILIAAIVAVLTAWGSYWKWQANTCRSEYEAFRISTAALGMAAKAKAEETKTRQNKTTKEVGNASKASRSRISEFYGNGLRLPADTSSGRVPAPPDNPKVADEPAKEPAPSRPGVTTESCALDAEQVMAWQEWARQQQLPVE
jgi:hypothetical protein